MGKKKLLPTPNFVGAPTDSHDFEKMANERYHREYGFKKGVSVRSPEQSEYAHKYSDEMMGKKEKNLVKGSSHKFKGRRLGTVYGNRVKGIK